MILNDFNAEVDKVATLETVVMGDIVTLLSVHLLQSLENQILKDAFQEDKLNFLI